MTMYRPSWVEINLNAVKYNLAQIKKRPGKKPKILAIVKADAYGHGAVAVSKVCVKNGVDLLGVALIEEGIQLREAGIKVPVLILGSIFPFSNYKTAIKYGLTPTVYSFEGARALAKIARQLHRTVKIHLKVDTGMGRVGIASQHAFALIEEITSFGNLQIEGIYTHFPAADCSDKESVKFTLNQIKQFRQIVEKARHKGIDIPLAHAANSAAVLKYTRSYFDLVRPGLMIYGLYPARGTKLHLRPALQFKTRIVYLKWVSAGRSVSYGRTWIARQPTRVATLPVGYADGYNRLLSNRGAVLVRGKRLPVIGRVCMDMCMVDVTPLKKEVKIGDEVVLIGRQGKERITAEEIADKMGTINYEVTCNISKRVPRMYKY